MLKLIIALLAAISFSVSAHHAAEGVVDETVYEMIDTMIAETPHANLTLDDLGGDMIMTIDTDTLVQAQDLIDDLLLYLYMLDGDVTLTLVFNDDGSVTMEAYVDNTE